VTHTRALPRPPAPLWREHPLFSGATPSGDPAFAGAEGFGAFTPGGRGGRTLYVENLNDRGPGSLRAAIEAAGPRTVAFRVGGAIDLKSKLQIREPFLTLDGAAAPSPGITLRNFGIEVNTHDVVLRYLRIRVGDDAVRLGDPTIHYEAGDGEHALYFGEGSGNSIADHLSLSWSTAKILSVTKMSDRITVQWCILSESLNIAGHGYASIAGGNRVTWHHNLLAHNLSRNVRFQGPVEADFRDNVIYDWGHTAAYGEFDRLNYVDNFLKPGPSTTQRPRRFHNGEGTVMPGSLFVEGNVMDGDARITADNWLGMGYDRESTAAVRPFDAPPVATQPAREAYELVLREAGATLPVRDAVDRRVVREVRDGTGKIIERMREVEDRR
jgi:hypothetical protein